MKLKFILPIVFIVFIVLFSVSCSEDSDDAPYVNELENLIKAHEIDNGTHTIALYTETGEIRTGYNAISLTIKNAETDSYIEDASVSWSPVMQMETMNHSCPNSAVTKAVNKTMVYEGFIIPQMTNTDGSGWSITINYSTNGNQFTATDNITVLQSEQKNVAVFTGSDEVKYVLALIEPTEPTIGTNNLVVGLYKMESMMAFPKIENFTIEVDPRMPDMGNHSSPNNTDLVYNSSDELYHSQLSLTMTGYWKLNLKVLNTENEILKGEDVTESNEASSLYLEIEF